MLAAGSWLIAAAGILAALTACEAASEPPAIPETTFPTNANGQSYGSAMYVDSPDEEPELIFAVATNGIEGYIYKTDLDVKAANPSEAAAMQQTRRLGAANAFAAWLIEAHGLDKADPGDEAWLELYDLTVEAFTGPPAQDRAGGPAQLGDQAVLGLRALGVSPEIDDSTLRGDLESALRAGQQTNERLIPVYESDGETQIGWFAVG
ncbi:MAG: hypothetical protein LBJ62_02940 [Bifidobacteriaceae bacterium]|nr:hypothetical protein [Bifidobacteriaceae bacterium]